MGGGWPARKDNLPHPLLVLSGRLKAAATQAGGGRTCPENDGRELAAGVEKSPSLPYTHVHQYGWPGRNIPARPFIDINEQTVDTCEGTVADALWKRLQT